MLPCRMRSPLTSARCFSPFLPLPSFLDPFPSCVPSLLPTSLRHRVMLKTARSFTTQLPDSEDSPTLTTLQGRIQTVVGGRKKKKSSCDSNREAGHIAGRRRHHHRVYIPALLGQVSLPLQRSIPLWQEHTLVSDNPEIESWRACALL